MLGFSVGMEAFEELLLINIPWSQEFSGFLQDLDLSLLPLIFSLILTVDSRLVHLYSTVDEMSRLVMESEETALPCLLGCLSFLQKHFPLRSLPSLTCL